MSIKFLVLGGGYFGFGGGGGGSADFIFMGARIFLIIRGPKSRNTNKTPRLHELFRKIRANFCLLPCDKSQEPKGNCSEKLVQMNFFMLGGFFRVDFLL